MLEAFIYLFAGTLSPRPKSDRKLLTRLQGIISGTLVERAQCRQEMREVQDAQPKPGLESQLLLKITSV